MRQPSAGCKRLIRRPGRCYAVSVVRLVTSFANLLVVLAVAAGVPQWYALEAGAGVCVLCSAEETVGVEALTSGCAPAESRASRDGSRGQFASAWKSAQPHPAIVPTGVILPSLGLSTLLGLDVTPFRTSAATSSHAVRGPPVDL